MADVNKPWVFRFKRWVRILLHLFVIDDSRVPAALMFQRGRREHKWEPKKGKA